LDGCLVGQGLVGLGQLFGAGAASGQIARQVVASKGFEVQQRPHGLGRQGGDVACALVFTEISDDVAGLDAVGRVEDDDGVERVGFAGAIKPFELDPALGGFWTDGAAELERHRSAGFDAGDFAPMPVDLADGQARALGQDAEVMTILVRRRRLGGVLRMYPILFTDGFLRDIRVAA